MSAAKTMIGDQKVWLAPLGNACLSNVAESALAGGMASSVVVSLWDDDLLNDDTAGGCSLRVEPINLLYGSQTLTLTQANGECYGHVGQVSVTIAPSN